MKKVLIYYRYFGKTLGGGEFLPLTFIAEIQKHCDVTLALEWTENIEQAAAFFGIELDFSKLEIVKVMPKKYHGTHHGVMLSLFRFRKLKKLAKKADICISLANIMDFGKPAHHFIITVDLGDPEFSDYIAKQRIPGYRRWLFALKKSLMNIFRHLLGMHTRKAIICDPKERIYPNSHYVEQLMQNFYGSFNGMVFYPPTIFEFMSSNVPRDPLKVVYLGRISPGKRIEDIIAIVKLARELSGKNITLSIAGHLDSAPYAEKLHRISDGMDWLSFLDPLYGKEKADFLLSGSFALHAMKNEAFGIAITEYLKAGLIPIVPGEGGACEVADNPELSFHDIEDAAAILVKLLNDPDFRKQQFLHCAERAALFSRQVYQEKQHRLLTGILETAE